MGVSFGSVFGKTNELVYPTDTKGEFLSELLWDMNPVFYLNLQVEFARANPMSAAGLYTALSFKTGIPGDSGHMENRDWMSAEDGNLTHFSSHTNKIKNLYWLDAVIGFSIPVKTWFYLRPFINGSWMHFSFSARDGYGKYARIKGTGTYYPINDNPDYYSFSGEEVIRYQQDWLLVAAGISIGTNVLYPLSFEMSFQISPFIYCAAVDNHLGRNIFFNDYTAWGLFFEPKGSVSYSIGRFNLSLELAYRYIGGAKGNTYINTGSRHYISANESGAGLGLLDARFFVKFRI